jgi:predicted 2-oxoglutarate/Fe(II)-dependent dioxygenase YbiX|tara:strand:- start:3119 stop:3661 length:543 start_codon:yes stop_codon:yes gene_type:complete
MKVNDYVFKTNLISSERCDYIVNQLDQINDWKKHEWYDPRKKTYFSYDKELEVSHNQKFSLEINFYLKLCLDLYIKKYSIENSFQHFTKVRWNKYKAGTTMKPHCDLIRDIFDGELKGVPLLSFVGLLNNTFEGGEFVINDEVINLNKGDILAFPSNFMYCHFVREIKNGERISFVNWGF